MKKIIYILLAIAVFFAVVGCSNANSGEDDIDVHTGAEKTDTLVATESGGAGATGVSMVSAFVEMNTVEDWLTNVGKVKFYEHMTPALVSSWDFMPFDMTEFSVPDMSEASLELRGISAAALSNVSFSYVCSDSGALASIRWVRHIDSGYAHRAQYLDVRGGPSSHEVVVSNGITYGISEWTNWDGSFWGYGASWSQYGKTFGLSLPAPFTRDDIFRIARMKQVEAWELDGDAVSVSIQGMENVRIFEQSANREQFDAAAMDVSGTELVVIGDALYRGGLGRSMERVGYRWPIDARLGRYQYVLMPGMYTFRADGISGTLGLTVRHFDGGEAVSVVDYSDRIIAENASGFYLTVTEDAGDTDLSYLSANHIFAVSSHDELRNAIQYLIDQGITEQTTITMTQDFTATGATIYVPVGVDIILTSTPGTVFTYTRTTAGRHFVVENGTLTLKDVIICGGTGTHARGGIEVRERGGHLFIEDGSIITNNRANTGGGITAWLQGRITMRGGIVEGNIASNRGAGVSANGAVFTMYGGVIRNNQAGIRAGGVNVSSSSAIFNMHNGIIELNTAPTGGGVGQAGGAINIIGTDETAIIRNNEAILDGGGIFFEADRVSSMTGGAVLNNRAGRTGGGIAISPRHWVSLPMFEGFVISGNQANYGGGIWVSGAPMHTGTIRLDLRGTLILNNHAVHDGGGIFTELGSIYQNPMPINAYENIAMMPTTQFLGNTAGNGAVSPPSNAAAVMQRSASVSVFDHQINNYDINFGLEGARTASVFSLDMVEAIDFAALEAFAERYSLDFEYIYEYFSGNRQHVDAQFDSAYSVYITE